MKIPIHVNAIRSLFRYVTGCIVPIVSHLFTNDCNILAAAPLPFAAPGQHPAFVYYSMTIDVLRGPRRQCPIALHYKKISLQAQSPEGIFLFISAAPDHAQGHALTISWPAPQCLQRGPPVSATHFASGTGAARDALPPTH